MALTVLVVAIMRYGADYRTPVLAVFGIYLVVYWLLGRPWHRKPIDVSEAMPVSGPIGRLGNHAIGWAWSITSVLALLNPFQLAQVLRQRAGNARLDDRQRRAGSDGSAYRTAIPYTLPFRGEWFVFNGGVTPETSHSWNILGQRFAIDFVRVDAEMRRHSDRGTTPLDYFCYGEDIVAAADGRVVDVDDGIGDAPFVGWGVCDFTARSFIGNFVLIEHAQNEFGLYAHLVRGSIRVAPGDTVLRGDTLGQCGHSGHSSEPHLHFHLQDSAELFEGMGLPVRFVSLVIDDEQTEGAFLSAGNRVRPVSR